MEMEKTRLNSVALQLNARKNSRYCPHCDRVVAISTFNKHKKRYTDASSPSGKRRKVELKSEPQPEAKLQFKPQPVPDVQPEPKPIQQVQLEPLALSEVGHGQQSAQEEQQKPQGQPELQPVSMSSEHQVSYSVRNF